MKMKTYKPILVTLLLLTLFMANIIAQPHIDSLQIIPGNPTSSDTVKIIAYTFSTGAPCNLTFYEVSTADSVITVNTHYLSGPLTVLCNSIDTAIIGGLNAGCYQVHYLMADTTQPVTYDVDTISFCVQQPGKLQYIDDLEQEVKIWPNPFSTAMTVLITREQLVLPVEIRMVDLFGREIKRISNIRSREITIARDNLKSGLYLIKVIGGDKIMDIRKVVVE